MSNGQYCMRQVCQYIESMPADLTAEKFCRLITSYIRFLYSQYDVDMELLTEIPTERMAASAVIYSVGRKEIWMVGDCQCLVGDEYFDNPKPYEQKLAEQRAEIIKSSPEPWDHYLSDDTARAAIIPLMLEKMKQQNVSYSVIDGFPIPERHVRIITLDFQPWEIVLASDGYPRLCPTLAESEAKLSEQKANDPLNIGLFKATKAFAEGNNSFDDRAYIRFKA